MALALINLKRVDMPLNKETKPNLKVSRIRPRSRHIKSLWPRCHYIPPSSKLVFKVSLIRPRSRHIKSLWPRCHYIPPSSKLVFKVLLDRPWSRCFKKIGGMYSAQKYSRISIERNTSQSTFCLRLKTIRKVSKLDVCLPHTFSETNKEDSISILINRLSRQKNDPFLRNIIW